MKISGPYPDGTFDVVVDEVRVAAVTVDLIIIVDGSGAVVPREAVDRAQGVPKRENRLPVLKPA